MRLIESKLEHIERMIVAIEMKSAVVETLAAAPLSPSHAHISPTAHSSKKQNLSIDTSSQPVYRDSQEPQAGTAISLLKDSDISSQDKAKMDFGQRLASLVGLPSIAFKIAQELPPSILSNNSFCDSYQYNIIDRCLLVHRDRLSSSGDFGLVVIHALSHIKVCQ